MGRREARHRLARAATPGVPTCRAPTSAPSATSIQDATITNESNFSKDWDGKRTLGICLDRVVGSTGERLAWPDASFTLPRFMSDFRKVEVPVFSQSLLAITPYRWRATTTCTASRIPTPAWTSSGSRTGRPS